jgi:nucleoside-diphosphate-sugar epimerase
LPEGQRLWDHATEAKPLDEIRFTLHGRKRQKALEVHQQIWSKRIDLPDASGIGAETAGTLKALGASVVGVDRVTPTHDACSAFHHADLSDPRAIDRLVDSLPSGLNGLCNIAGLPPTSAADLVLKVNVLGLKRLTLKLIDKLADVRRSCIWHRSRGSIGPDRSTKSMRSTKSISMPSTRFANGFISKVRAAISFRRST